MAWVSSGTVSVTNGSTTVTGTGTSWFGAMQNGWGFVGPDGRVYEILTVDSADTITLKTPYQGSTAAAQAYAVFPTGSHNLDLTAALQQLLSNYQGVYDTVGQGRFPGEVVFDADRDTGMGNPSANELGLKAGDVWQLLLKGGQASGAAVQDSATDATAGKLLTVGAFGLGGSSLPTLEDCNKADLVTGVYRTNSSTLNVPPASNAWGMMHVTVAGSVVTQLWLADGTSSIHSAQRMWVRTGSLGGAYSAWQQMITGVGDQSINGTLTTTGGINLGQDTLDYYDEGIWTPILSDGNNNATAAANGTFVRIGDMVFVTGRIPLTSLGSVSGPLRIYGLPFVVTNSSAAQGSGVVGRSTNTNLAAAVSMMLFTQQGDTFCYINKQSAGGTSGVLASDLTATTDLQFSLTYKTN
ncbi:MAG: hypothetical protein EpisKO_15420 [Epibacterium sp.]